MKAKIEDTAKTIEIKIKKEANSIAKLSQEEYKNEIQKIIDSEISGLITKIENELNNLVRELNARLQNIELIKKIFIRYLKISFSVPYTDVSYFSPRSLLLLYLSWYSLLPGLVKALFVPAMLPSFLPYILLEMLFSKTKEEQIIEKAPEIAKQVKNQLEQELGKHIQESLIKIEKSINYSIRNIKRTIIKLKYRKGKSSRYIDSKKIELDIKKLKEIIIDLRKNI